MKPLSVSLGEIVPEAPGVQYVTIPPDRIFIGAGTNHRPDGLASLACI